MIECKQCHEEWTSVEEIEERTWQQWQCPCCSGWNDRDKTTFIAKPGHYWYVFNPVNRTSGMLINGALFTWAPYTLKMRAACVH